MRVGVLPIVRVPYRVQIFGQGVTYANEGYAEPRLAHLRVAQLLQSRKWAGNGMAIRVLGPDGFLYGQWILSSGAWCHQGGPWKSTVPHCTGVMPPKPTYPSAPYLGAPPKWPSYRGGWW